MNKILARGPRLFVWTAVMTAALAFAASASAMTLQSEATWGGPDSDVTSGVAVAGDGSTYIVGMTRNFGVESTAAFVVKHAASGSIAWQRTWDSTSAFSGDEAHDVALAADGSVYVVGTTFGTGGDTVLLKFSPDGTLLWQRNWGGSRNDAGRAVAVGPDGGVYVAGGTTSFGSGDTDLFVVKFAPDGTLTWQRTWASPGYEDGQGVAVAGDGSVYVAGTANRPGPAFAWDTVLVKLDSAGSLVWQRAYSAEEIADARGGVAVAPDGSIYVAGAVQDSSDTRALLLKFATDGALEWDRAWGGRSGDSGEGVAVGPDGTVVLVGSSNSHGAGSDDAFVLRVQPNARGIDAVTWGSPNLDNGTDVVVAGDGTIVVGGTTTAPPPYSFLEASRRLSRARGTIAAPSFELGSPTGTVGEPAGVVGMPNGSPTYAGGAEAALVRIAP